MIRITKHSPLSVIYLSVVMLLIASGKCYLNAQHISSEKTIYMPKEEVVLSFSQVPPNSKNWIGIYKKGEIPGEINSTSWSYVGEDISGVKVFNSLPSGMYDAHFMLDDSYNILTSTKFKVLLPDININLAGEAVKVNWAFTDNSILQRSTSLQGPWKDIKESKLKGDYVQKAEGTSIFFRLAVTPESAFNYTPFAFSQRINLYQDESIDIKLVAEDIENDTLVYTIIDAPDSGEITGQFGDFTYKPKPGFVGKDTFSFRVDDGHSESNTVSVSLSVLKNEQTILLVNGVHSSIIVNEYEKWDKIKIEFSGVSEEKMNSDNYIVVSGIGDTSETFVFQSITGESSGERIFTEIFQPGSYEAMVVINGFKTASSKFKVSNPPGDSKEPTWTVLIYANGDNNLTANLLLDMLEMEGVGSDDNFNIILQADFDSTYSSVLDEFNIPPSSQNQVTRFRIERSNNTDSGKLYSPALELLNEKDMDDPAVLKEFLDWGITNYPADRYGLILWDHGGQFYGFGGDHQNSQRSSWSGLFTADIKDVLSETLQDKGVNKLDFISFDTCLMGGVEVLVDFHEFCDVFIANPEIDYGDGWDFKNALGYLKDFPSISTIEFAEKENEIWNNHHSTHEADIGYKVHSIYDMNNYENFNIAFKEFANELSKYSSNNYGSIPGIRKDSIHYYNSGSRIRAGAIGDTDFIDLGTFSKRLYKMMDGDLKMAAYKLYESINNMVVFKSLGTSRDDALGLSIYYPTSGKAHIFYEEDKKYKLTNVTEPVHVRLNFLNEKYGGDKWKNHLDNTNLDWQGDKTAPVIQSSDSGKSGRIPDWEPESITTVMSTYDEPVILGFEVENGEDAHAAYVSLVSNNFTDNKNLYVYLGEIASAELAGNGKYEIGWDSTIPIVSFAGSDEYTPIYLGGWAMEAGSNLYVSYADYQPAGSTEYIPLILISSIDEFGYGKIDTILEDTVQTGELLDNNLGSALSSTKSNLKLENGGKLWPVYYAEEIINNVYVPSYVSFDDIVIEIPENGTEGLEVSFLPVETGFYDVEIQTVDNFNNLSEVLTFFVEVPDE